MPHRRHTDEGVRYGTPDSHRGRRRPRRRYGPLWRAPLEYLGVIASAAPIWVRDVRTGARLRTGVRYPLEHGGVAEIVRVSLPRVFRPASVLIRFSRIGRLASYHWIQGILSGESVYIEFPTIDMTSILTGIERGLQ